VSDQIVWERINSGTGSGVILTDFTRGEACFIARMIPAEIAAASRFYAEHQ
jgi:hypothetical protein